MNEMTLVLFYVRLSPLYLQDTQGSFLTGSGDFLAPQEMPPKHYTGVHSSTLVPILGPIGVHSRFSNLILSNYQCNGWPIDLQMKRRNNDPTHPRTHLFLHPLFSERSLPFLRVWSTANCGITLYLALVALSDFLYVFIPSIRMASTKVYKPIS